MDTVYFDVGWDMENSVYHDEVQRFTPSSTGAWNGIQSVTDPEIADYHVVFNKPSQSSDPSKRIMYCMEPPCVPHCNGWEDIQAARKYPLSIHYKPQAWWIDKSYDELKSMSPPDKTERCSWIISAKGRDLNLLLRPIRKFILKTGVKKFEQRGFSKLDFPTDGHILRMNFLERAGRRYPDLLDLYSTDAFDSPYYQGDIGMNKWEGLKDYKYSLALASCKTKNYWTEKFTDAILSWCMPIHWGCTNLDEYLPEDSYIWLDIEDPDAPRKLKGILEDDPWEDNLEAIAEARERILDEYQIFPTVSREINGP